jgi:hypothetical protein
VNLVGTGPAQSVGSLAFCLTQVTAVVAAAAAQVVLEDASLFSLGIPFNIQIFKLTYLAGRAGPRETGEQVQTQEATREHRAKMGIMGS